MTETEKTKEQLENEIQALRKELSRLQTGKVFEKKYRAIFEQSSEALMLLDANTGAKVEYNDRACDILGYTREEFRDIGLTDVEASKSMDEIERDAADLYNGAMRFETKHRRKDGQIRDVLVCVQQITIDNEESYILIQWTDITEQKQSEKLIEEKQQKLENTVTALNSLVQDMEKEKKFIEENILSKMCSLVEPYFKKLLGLCHDPEQIKCLEMIESNLKKFRAYRSETMSELYTSLTRSEAQIANLIKYDKSTKDIARIMGLSGSTVDFHRKNIRKKLGLNKKKISLKKYLLSPENNSI